MTFTQQIPRTLRDALVQCLPDATDSPTAETMFLANDVAFRPDLPVVTGGIGQGKTFWCRALLDDELRRYIAHQFKRPRLADARVRLLTGSDSILVRHSPRFRDPRTSPHQVWLEILADAVHAAPASDANHTVLDRLQQLDRSTNTQHLVLLDDIDSVWAGDARARVRALESLLSPTAALRSLKNLCLKAYVRRTAVDGVDEASLKRTAHLAWTPEHVHESVLQLLLHTAGPTADSLRNVLDSWKTVAGVDRLDYRVREDLVRHTRREACALLYPRERNTSGRAGSTYDWVASSTLDGNSDLSPARVYTLLRHAASVSTAPGLPITGMEELHSGLQAAAAQATAGLQLVSARAAQALGCLRLARQVPVAWPEVAGAWTDAGLGDADEVRGELVGLGVVRLRSNGDVDLADIYRVGAGVGRRGGVPRTPVQ